MSASPELISQEELDGRRAAFGNAVEQVARPLAAPREGCDAPVADGREDTVVTVRSLAGDMLWGPAVTGMTSAGSLLELLASDLGKPSGRMQLLHGSLPLHSSASLRALSCGPDCAQLDLTLVFSIPVPDEAVIIGDLAVWKSGAGFMHRPKQFSENCRRIEKLRGRNTLTGEVFYHKADFGRSNRMHLRYGDSGLWFNSTSHGTVSLSFRVYVDNGSGAGSEARKEPGDGEDEDDGAAAELTIIPGPHLPDSAPSRDGLDTARLLAQQLLRAAGREVPPLGLGEAPWQVVEAWQKLLADLGTDGPAATLWSVLFLPWLGTLNRMNETDIWVWAETGFPASLSEMPADSAKRLERDMGAGA